MRSKHGQQSRCRRAVRRLEIHRSSVSNSALNPRIWFMNACGVMLSEELQLHPEQSTDAFVLHHPEAKYFNV